MSAYADERAVFDHCRTTPGLISDGAARTIASWWADDLIGSSFVTTGAVPDGVWNAITDRGVIVRQVNADHRLALEKLHDYLNRHAGRGPVTGWSEVWVR
ncbi:hypothetical protein [Streptomyces sp. NPDC088910]|uniref:hypothetical protein n=1 Tax=unclassified Streptomyces TaxID=2593676 RepID=UPI00380A41C8